MNTPHNSLIPTQNQLSQLQDLVGYRFTDHTLLLRALTHRSFRAEHPELVTTDNETLEFLGDAVLDLVIGAKLIALYPNKTEGELTKLRSALVQEKHLFIVANDLDFGRFLLLGKGEDQSGGRLKSSILASTYEAVIGAIFTDSDYPTTQEIIEHHFHARIDMAQMAMEASDPKSALQELTQEKLNAAPAYILKSTEGPDHAKIFTVSVHLLGRCVASASARSKKAAEQKAAAAAIAHIRQP